MFLQDPNIFGELLSTYGPAGVAFGVLLAMLIRKDKAADKRLVDLEKKYDDSIEDKNAAHTENLQAHKDMIEDYVELVRNKTQVLADLTACLRAIKDAIERIERKD